MQHLRVKVATAHSRMGTCLVYREIANDSKRTENSSLELTTAAVQRFHGAIFSSEEIIKDAGCSGFQGQVSLPNLPLLLLAQASCFSVVSLLRPNV
jgi:hypothetical protein